MRLIDPDLVTGLNDDVIVPVILFSLDTTPPIRLHSSIGEIEYDGNTYLGVGHFGGIDRVNESQFLQPERITLTLAGFPLQEGQVLGDIEYKNKRVQLTLLLYNKDTLQRIDAAINLFAGEADVLSVEYGDTVSYALTVSNELVAWKEGSNQVWSDRFQKYLYPDDRGFEYLTELEEKEIVW